MVLSKRLRFEVFRRDGHRCRYCGAPAGDRPLTVDHVVPVALGGSDDPSNLAAACSDCNSGKTSITPDAPLVAEVDQDAIRWAAAMSAARQQAVLELDDRDEYCGVFVANWARWDKDCAHLDPGWKATVARWRADGLPIELLVDATDIAMRAGQVRWAGVFRYMCGIVRNQMHKIATEARTEFDTSAQADHNCCCFWANAEGIKRKHFTADECSAWQIGAEHGRARARLEAAAAIYSVLAGGGLLPADIWKIIKDVDYRTAVYRRAARTAHPDTGGTTAAFLLLQQSKQTLNEFLNQRAS